MMTGQKTRTHPLRLDISVRVPCELMQKINFVMRVRNIPTKTMFFIEALDSLANEELALIQAQDPNNNWGIPSHLKLP